MKKRNRRQDWNPIIYREHKGKESAYGKTHSKLRREHLYKLSRL